MADLNLLAALLEAPQDNALSRVRRAPAVSVAPMQSNMLTGMMAPNPIADLPPTPARETLTAPRDFWGTPELARRYGMAQLLEPGSAFDRFGMGFIGPATVRARGGIPQTWLHGTSGNFDQFDMSRAGQISSGAGDGIWLTQNRGYASGYAQNASGITGEAPNIMDVRATPRNPLVVEWSSDGRLRAGDTVLDVSDNADVLRYARRNGHDSVYWVDSSFTDDGPTLTAFTPEILRILP